MENDKTIKLQLLSYLYRQTFLLFPFFNNIYASAFSIETEELYNVDINISFYPLKTHICV